MRKIKLFFLNLSLTGKMIVFYIIAVLLPTFALGTGLYFVNMNAMRQTYYQNQRYEVASVGASLNVQTTRILAAANLLQESSSLLNILGGVYPNMSHTIFYYLRDVQPLLNVANTNPHIQNIRIYGFGDMLLNMHFGVTSMRYLAMHEGFADGVDGVAGTWIVLWEEQEPILKYYRIIHAPTFPFRRGLLEFRVDIDFLIEPFRSFNTESLYFIVSDHEIIRYQDNAFYRLTYQDEMTVNDRKLAFDVVLQSGLPDMKIYIRPVDSMPEQHTFILLMLIITITVFTALYFLLTKFITGRLQEFKQHIQRTDIVDIKPFDSESKDEIGVVISSYNDLVARTNTLIHENLLAQLKKKEAEYYALQSQIKPHFLYNILENIRMSAEANDDSETANMLTILGNYMRYSLNMGSLPISLEQELLTARNYLQIHKIRMKEKIEYSIEISTEIDDVLVPRFLIQPLLENAVKHGYCLDQPLHIHVSITDGEILGRPDCVILTIKNDGNGIAAEQLQELQRKLRLKETAESNHIGLLNVNRRISTFYQMEEECIFLESHDGEGATITILLKRGEQKNGNNVMVQTTGTSI